MMKISELVAQMEAELIRLGDLEHRMSQIKDALDELKMGFWPKDGPPAFVVWAPGDEKPHAVPPERVQGVYECYARKITELGNWSTLKDLQREKRLLLEANMRLKEKLESGLLGGLPAAVLNASSHIVDLVIASDCLDDDMNKAIDAWNDVAVMLRERLEEAAK